MTLRKSCIIEQYIMKKSTRTISGVTPIAVMSPPAGCPGKCIYCPDFNNTPRSYTPHSPAVMRAASRDYDAAEQVDLRLKILQDMGHPTDKVELIIMGGTFLATSISFQYRFIKDCFDALNGRVSESLSEAQGLNETAQHRAVGLCLETRPDVCGDAEIERMVAWGTTRVELGVQMLDDKIYEIVGRGHDIAAVADASRRLRNAGLKVHYHWMPGLPGSTPEHDLELTQEIFKNPDYRPDGLKLYPTMVVEGTILEEWHQNGRYQPYSDETMTGLIADMKKTIPGYVRISRVLRDIPAEYVSGGLKNSLRDGVRTRLEEEGLFCRCIRCREYGHRLKRKLKIGTPGLKRTDYQASAGHEIFLSFEDEYDTLFGLLRLRIQAEIPKQLADQYENVALIRELHVYGSELAIGDRNDESVQHRGYGRRLLSEAEQIAREEYGAQYAAILSGVGARSYYREQGYTLHSSYMVKTL
ncbi:tRNA uridine(34) 5-carboxymethylaminomethyl modification radical SAM/GNAT enzyme Elp3 [Candidatus Dehalogenimonas loeffleri]|uniref:tRNA carboxymethyluridine synthase n=1 Tax=Candidatus Dehalogenimonas loeffleri TaxID=3127115 RepID=A0ABZ2J9M9_9CHLR